MTNAINILQNDLRIELIKDVSFKTLTTYKTGGTCHYLAIPSDIDSLIFLIKTLKENNVKYKIFGNGSNILASDNYYDGVIIKLSKLNTFKIKDCFVDVMAGCNLIPLSLECANNNLSGLEWASGIPGTIGGAVYMNAGAYLKSMADIVQEVKVLDENCNIITLSIDELNYSYRSSSLMGRNCIVLSALLKMTPMAKEEIIDLINDRKERRKNSQPYMFPSAGSVFRNPENDYAGRLIEECNLKGYFKNGAQISDIHANFIVNKNNASSTDIKKLMDLAKEEVYKKFNVSLKVEQELFNWE